MNPGKSPINPMKEGHPEPFPEPRTIPTGWDLSEYLDKSPEDDQKNFFSDPDADEDRRDFPARL